MGETLLLKRLPPREFWQSITGSMKWDEASKPLAAVRELQEETGIQVAPSQLQDWKWQFKYEILPEYRRRYPSGVVYNVEHMFSIKLSGPCDIELDPTEHSDYRWEPIDSAIESVWSWSNRKALELVRDEILQSQK